MTSPTKTSTKSRGKVPAGSKKQLTAIEKARLEYHENKK